MYSYGIFSLILGCISTVKCVPSLEITKNFENFLSPVTTVIEENAGTTFSLVCELVSQDISSTYFDENLSWMKDIKADNESRRTQPLDLKSKNLFTLVSKSEINKSEKHFSPLRLSDRGRYYCVSFKYNMYQKVDIAVRDDIRKTESRPWGEPMFCSEQMFQCASNGVCIIQHYVCDGKVDCKDGSDESVQRCGEDPCKDKIPCEDGRCIPTGWCCDRNHDLNCSVVHRPKCCQILSESYEELEYGFPNVTPNHQNGARYLFISVCILSILFSIVLLLLILSKVVIFAKKTALQQQRQNICEGMALRNQTSINLIRTNYNYMPCGITTTYRTPSRTPARTNFARNIIIDTSDVSDLLIYPPQFNTTNNQDQPPSYVDVLRSSAASNDPPPPYASREMLNGGIRRS